MDIIIIFFSIQKIIPFILISLIFYIYLSVFWIL